MAIRLSGMISGLDTDSIVQELVSAYSKKKDNIVKDQTKLSWKQEIWKELNTKISKLYSSTLSDLRFTTAYNNKKTTVSDPTKASVTAGSGSTNGSQILEVKNLAKSAYLTGEEIKVGDGSTKISGTSSLSELGLDLPTTIKIALGSGEATEIELGAGTTVNGLVSSLKSAGMNASFDAAYQRFFISSKNSGLDGNFTLSADSAEGNDALVALGLTSAGAVKIEGEDAEIILNGASFKSSSNTFNVNGLAITATGVTTEKITISTDANHQATYDTIKNFITEYNKLVNEMDSLYNASTAKGYTPLTDEDKESMSEKEIEKWEEKIKDSLLRRDETLGSITSTMKAAMAKSYSVNGMSYNLSSFGINTLSYFNAGENEKGAYHIDGDSEDSASSGNADKLMAAVASNPDDITSFFSQLTSELYNGLDSRMKSTELSSFYTVYNDKQLQSDYDNYSKQISKWEEKVAAMEEKYYRQFTAMETAMSKLQSQSSALAGLLGTN